MKKLLMAAIGLMMAVSANAQYLNVSEPVFYQGKFMIGASASGLDLSYHKGEKWRLNLDAKAGYLFIDDWMVTGKLGYDNSTYGHSSFNVGAGLRYYIEQNGIYVGAGAKYAHTNGIDDLLPEANVGYAFFLSRHITIEPEIYYELSTKCSDYSGFGLKLGFALYF
jgi:hypothetical protein